MRPKNILLPNGRLVLMLNLYSRYKADTRGSKWNFDHGFLHPFTADAAGEPSPFVPTRSTGSPKFDRTGRLREHDFIHVHDWLVVAFCDTTLTLRSDGSLCEYVVL